MQTILTAIGTVVNDDRLIAGNSGIARPVDMAADRLKMDAKFTGDPPTGPPVTVQCENGLNQCHLELSGHSLSLPAFAGSDTERPTQLFSKWPVLKSANAPIIGWSWAPGGNHLSPAPSPKCPVERRRAKSATQTPIQPSRLNAMTMAMRGWWEVCHILCHSVANKANLEWITSGALPPPLFFLVQGLAATRVLFFYHRFFSSRRGRSNEHVFTPCCGGRVGRVLFPFRPPQ